jgi:replicative DNA helicase
MRRFAAKRLETPIGLVIVDYLQLLESVGKKHDNRTIEVGSFSRGLKLMAGDLKVPVIALSQLNRASEDRAEPELRDLRESGSLEQDANTVVFIHRTDQRAALYSDVVPVRMLMQEAAQWAFRLHGSAVSQALFCGLRKSHRRKVQRNGDSGASSGKGSRG